MAPQLKLTYFNAPGRAEVSRLALHYGNIEFTDERVSGETFAAMKEKNTLPFGQLPVLDIDDTTIAQSGAIQRYAAKLAGLYPDDDPKMLAEVEMVLGALEDLVPKLIEIVFGSDEEQKQDKIEAFVKVAMPKTFTVLEARAREDTKFMLREAPTLADIALFSFIHHAIWKNFGKDAFLESTYPRLHQVVENVGQLPSLQKYLETSLNA